MKDIIEAHATYTSILKKHRNLRRDIAVHLSAAVPDGVAFEWSQGSSKWDQSLRFAVNGAIVFPAKQHVLKNDGELAEGYAHNDPLTEWVDTEDAADVGFFIDEGLSAYTGTIVGFTKGHLRALLKVWRELPLEVLDKAYGDAVVRVLSNGKFTTQEN